MYVGQDFTRGGKLCAAQGLLYEPLGLSCYMSLGLSQSCAQIWNYDGIYDGRYCMGTCLRHLFSANNGPAPKCELNSCLQCDEAYAGPIFKAVAGRTRRRSGLKSEIIRPCDAFHANKYPVHAICDINPNCKCGAPH